jgi:uncharacterized protein YukE
MDHSAVLTIAAQLDTDQQNVADLMQRAQGAVTALGQNWFGRDSSQFASDWATRSTQLTGAADVIAVMSRQARAQAADQATTSKSWTTDEPDGPCFGEMSREVAMIDPRRARLGRSMRLHGAGPEGRWRTC